MENNDPIEILWRALREADHAYACPALNTQAEQLNPYRCTCWRKQAEEAISREIDP